jgi:signal transduction histidine kinase
VTELRTRPGPTPARQPQEDRILLRRAWWRSVALTAAGMTLVLLMMGGVALVLVDRHQSAALDRELAQILAAADDVGDPPPGFFLAQPRADGTVAVTPTAPAALRTLLTTTANGSPDDPALTEPHDVALPGTGTYRIQLIQRSDQRRWAIASDLARLSADQHEVMQAILLAEATGLAGTLAAAALLSRRAVAPLARALRLQRRFVADASHELRAPLTVLHTRAQILAAAPSLDPDSSLAHGLHGLVDDTRALGDVIEDLLVSAELDRHPRRMQHVDLNVVAAAVCQSMAAHAAAHDVHLSHTTSTDAVDPLLVTGHPAALRRAMTALVDNAIAHTPAGGTVDLHTAIHDGQAEVVVTDTGIGFEPSTADALFTRSRHADHGARPRFGLGLALVSEIAHAHGGSVRADGKPGRGARFTLRLPAPDRSRHRADSQATAAPKNRPTR